VVKENDLPAHRYIADVEAVILDPHLDDMVKRKAAPGLFRMAVEAAAHQRFFTNHARAGAGYHESDEAWEDAKTTQQCVALAVTGAASNDLAAWKSLRANRFPTMAICASGAHNGAALDRTTIRDLRATVRELHEDLSTPIDEVIEEARSQQAARVTALEVELEAARKALADLD
jgi:hypothetical protein